MEEIFGPGGLLEKHHPAYEHRPEQVKMAEAVWRAISEGRHLCVEAGTGTGKTLAYLLPAVKSGSRVVVSTGTKTLQEQLYFKDVPFLEKALGRKLSVAYMKGRHNYLCLLKLERAAREPGLYLGEARHLLDEIARWSRQTATGDLAELGDLPEELPLWRQLDARRETCLGQKCKLFEQCFVTRMRQRALESDIIIVNHYLFFADLALKEWDCGTIIPEYRVVIFDEAHELEDVATNYFGISVSSYRFAELARDALAALDRSGEEAQTLRHALKALDAKAQWFFALFGQEEGRFRLPREFFSDGGEEGWGGRLRRAAGDLENSLAVASAELTELAGRSDDDEYDNLARRASELSAELSFILRGSDKRFVYWYEVRGRGVFLQASPIDVAPILASRLFAKVDSAILTSATLSTGGNFEFIKQRLGLSNCDELRLGTHFDYMSQAMLYLPRHLPDPREPEFAGQAADEIEKILRATEGRAFVLFTSYQQMQQVYALLCGRLPYPMLIQGEMSKRALLEKFKSTPGSVLFATASFWQGVDVQGPALSCVVIDKLPFSVPTDPIISARVDLLAESGRNPFYEYQLPEAVIMLKQGLGRLIRSRSDRGVLCILDKRILTRGYGRAFIESLPRCRLARDVEELRLFLAES